MKVSTRIDIALATLAFMLVVATIVTLFALPGCSIEGAPVPGPAAVSQYSEITADVAPFAKKYDLPLDDLRIVLIDEAGVSKAGCFGRGFPFGPSKINVYLKNCVGVPLPRHEVRDVLRHELLHWYDYCKGIPAPPNGKHSAEFDERIKKEWGPSHE